MASKLQFVQLDVFTTGAFTGNPLAIVHIPEQHEPLNQTQKQRIAREFNLSETVFLHETSNRNAPVTIDIFTTTEELPFAGHPTVGSGWYLLQQGSPERRTVTLRTKAGDIPVTRESKHSVRLRVPVDFKIHEPYAEPKIKRSQAKLTAQDYANGPDAPEALVSIVKGMTFVLMELASEDALAKLQPYSERFRAENLGDWAGFLGVYAFFVRDDGTVRTRMFDGSLEDPATGSAASTLGGWLAKKKGPGEWKFEIIQGVEIGRRSEITVFAVVEDGGEITQIELGGSAVEVMQGQVRVM